MYMYIHVYVSIYTNAMRWVEDSVSGYIYIYIHKCIYIYIYIYTERESTARQTHPVLIRSLLFEPVELQKENTR